jgi:DNA-binding NarL/FixJ family response regulator
MTINARGGLPPPSVGTERRSDPSRKGMSIVLIDRRALTRQCLSRWLQDASPDLHVFSVSSPAELLDPSGSFKDPQLIVFSIGGASVNDAEVLHRITLLRRHMGRIPLALLSDRDDVDEIVAAIEHGVRGYIPTSLELSEAAAAIHCVEAGGTFVPVSVLIRIAQDRQHDSHRGSDDPDRRPFESLTPREAEVLARLRQGKPNKIIAYELDISESTVKVFVRRILTKLHASNRTEVASLLRGQFSADEIEHTRDQNGRRRRSPAPAETRHLALVGKS